ncbi:MAG: formylglycine-generating enzyme family protein [Planctomycetes bacterium]|nr:formylglycine-generating enzyme family protein [Planctomycetota bacterium]
MRIKMPARTRARRRPSETPSSTFAFDAWNGAGTGAHDAPSGDVKPPSVMFRSLKEIRSETGNGPAIRKPRDYQPNLNMTQDYTENAEKSFNGKDIHGGTQMICIWGVGVAIVGWMVSDGAGSVVTAPVREAPGKVILDLGGGVKMEFVRITAGTLTMGGIEYDEKPLHEVTITKDFWMQTTETTQAQWEAVMGTNPSHFKGADRPVECVSWEECQEFMKRLNLKAKDALAGKTAKLPTEAQWEYACRAGEKGTWCFGDNEEELGDYAWYGENSDDQTHPVGRKKANGWGLCDMHGNVWEWCQDWYEEKYPSGPVTDPAGPANAEFRCLRGGSWCVCDDAVTRSAGRGKGVPANRGMYTGLRAALGH